MDHTNYYYAFSTISQTMAAFLSLSAIFILSYLKYYSKMILYHANSFSDSIPAKALTDNNVVKLVQQIKFKLSIKETLGLIEIVLEISNYAFQIPDLWPVTERGSDHLKRVRYIMDKSEERDSIKRSFIYALFLGFFSIILSLIVIPFIPKLTVFILYSFVIIAILSAMVSMLSLFQIMYRFISKM